MNAHDDILMQAALCELSTSTVPGAYSLAYLERSALRRLTKRER